jgi:hypothetical protein
MAENDKLRRYLVVTDHALDDQQLAATVQPSLAAGPCQFYLLVLVTPAGSKERIWWEVAVGGYSDRSQPSSTASAPNPGPARPRNWAGIGSRTTRSQPGSPAEAGR